MSSSRDLRAPEGIPHEAREAINAVFDALSAWREEVGASTERCSESVLAKMAPAAEALGWPKEFVEASHKYLVQSSKLQIHMIDQLMDAWREQLRSPTPVRFLARLRALPSIGLGATPGVADFASAPFDMWLQAAEMWQRNWATTLSAWAGEIPGSEKVGERGKHSGGSARTH